MEAAPSPLSIENLGFGYVTNVLWLLPIMNRFSNLQGLSLKWWHSEHDVTNSFSTLFQTISNLHSLKFLGLEMGDFNNSYNEEDPLYTDEMFSCIAQNCPLEGLRLSAMNVVLGKQTMSHFKSKNLLRGIRLRLRPKFNEMLETAVLQEMLEIPSLRSLSLSFNDWCSAFTGAAVAVNLLKNWLADRGHCVRLPRDRKKPHFVDCENALS
jgi:hypothetical protein